MSGERTLLPARPLGLRASFYVRRAAFGLFLAALAILGAAGSVWAISDAWSIRADQQIWDTGVRATDGAVHGEVQSRGIDWIMAFYDLEVSYVDAEGARHRGELDFATMLGSVDTDADPELRHDRDHPERFALSWAVDASGARWRWVVLGGALFGVLGALFVWVTFLSIKETGAIRRCARSGLETVVRVVNAMQLDNARGRRISKFRYSLLVPRKTGGEDLWLEEVDLAKTRPLFADPTEGSAYALIAPTGATRILLRADLYPLAVTATERRDIHARADSRAGKR